MKKSKFGSFKSKKISQLVSEGENLTNLATKIDRSVNLDKVVFNASQMLEDFSGQFIRKTLAESIAHRRKVRNLIQQSIPQKPAVG